ncbi:hypothetical protein [Streptomyces sp. NPDC048612]
MSRIGHVPARYGQIVREPIGHATACRSEKPTRAVTRMTGNRYGPSASVH